MKKEYGPKTVRILCRDKGRILLLKSVKRPNYWEMPGGKNEAGETPLETARRELKEETNLSAAKFKYLHGFSRNKPEVPNFQSKFIFLKLWTLTHRNS